METWTEAMRDAAYRENLGDWDGVCAGYVPFGDPFHAWETADWQSLPGLKKLPTLAMSSPGDEQEAERIASAMLDWLKTLSVPAGAPTALDLEEAVNEAWVTRYGLILNESGYKVFPYGPTSTLFSNPQLNGYWVAAPSSDGQPYMYERPGSLIRITQYRQNVDSKYDSSAVKPWTLAHIGWWR